MNELDSTKWRIKSLETSIEHTQEQILFWQEKLNATEEELGDVQETLKAIEFYQKMKPKLT